MSTSAVPADLLAAEAARLSDLWQPSDVLTDTERYRLRHLRHLDRPPYSAEDICLTSLAFSAKTSQTFDGFHVKQSSYLSEDGLACLALLFQASLATSELPPQISYLIAFLIAKAKGGFRALGLLPAYYRLLLRCLRPRLRDWERSYKKPFYSFSAGRSCIWLLWRQSVAAVTCAHAGLHCAMILWDMSDYYEHICRSSLRDRSVITGFPLDILDITCNMYGCERVLMMGEAVVKTGRPSRGVVAGCTCATYHVQSFAGPPMESFSLRHKHLDLNLHVDDVIIDTEADCKDTIIHRLSSAAEDLQFQLIEYELGCQISAKKAALAANDHDLHHRLGKCLGKFGRYSSPAAVHLGISFAAGKTRSTFKKVNTIGIRIRMMELYLARLRWPFSPEGCFPLRYTVLKFWVLTTRVFRFCRTNNSLLKACLEEEDPGLPLCFC